MFGSTQSFKDTEQDVRKRKIETSVNKNQSSVAGGSHVLHASNTADPEQRQLRQLPQSPLDERDSQKHLPFDEEADDASCSDYSPTLMDQFYDMCPNSNIQLDSAISLDERATNSLTPMPRSVKIQTANEHFLHLLRNSTQEVNEIIARLEESANVVLRLVNTKEEIGPAYEEAKGMLEELANVTEGVYEDWRTGAHLTTSGEFAVAFKG